MSSPPSRNNVTAQEAGVLLESSVHGVNGRTVKGALSRGIWSHPKGTREKPATAHGKWTQVGWPSVAKLSPRELPTGIRPGDKRGKAELYRHSF